MSAQPVVSVVLATDELRTLSHVVPRFAEQTIAERTELVVVAPAGVRVATESEHLGRFAAVTPVEVEDVTPLARARAAGIRASSAPLVLVGETHALPAADLLERLVDALDDGWAGVVPGFRNANPDGPVSWSNLILTYGRYVSDGGTRELGDIPAYNACFRRDVLLEYGPDLDFIVEPGSGLSDELRARGHRFALVGDAALHHVNLSRTSAWIPERFVCGRVFAQARARRWPRWRRAAYVAAAPLLPVPFLRHALRTWREIRHDAPATTLPVTLVGTLAWIAGEVCGYALGAGDADRRVTEYELHRFKYIRRPFR